MNAFRHIYLLPAIGAMLLSGCAAPHGQPRRGAEPWRRTRFWNSARFTPKTARAATARTDGGGTAIALADPVYLAVADDAAMRRVVANGVRGTAMPALAESAGGLLTCRQIDIIIQGMRSR